MPRSSATPWRISIALITTAVVLTGCGGNKQPESLPERARAYYEAHPDEFRRPESREIRHILHPSAQFTATLYRRLRGRGEQAFARAAIKHSIDRTSSNQGGRMTLYRGESPKPLDRVAFQLDPGSLSRPVRTSAGYHLVYAVGPVQKAGVRPFEEVEGQIRTRLKNSD